jgi:hypothetical protein
MVCLSFDVGYGGIRCVQKFIMVKCELLKPYNSKTLPHTAARSLAREFISSLEILEIKITAKA